MLLFTSSIFLQFILLGLHSAILSILCLLFFIRNAILSVLLLVCVFIFAAGFFVFFNAVYIAAVIIIVYVGAIAVLFLFVIMLTHRVYTERSSFLSLLGLVGVISGLIESCISLLLNFLGVGVFWLDRFFVSTLISDLNIQLVYFAEPLGKVGVLFFNQYSLYLLSLGTILLVVLVGIVILLRSLLTSHLVVNRAYTKGSLRWRQILGFRDFVPLRRIGRV